MTRSRKLLAMLPPLLLVISLVIGMGLTLTSENCGYVNGLCPGEDTKMIISIFAFGSAGIFTLVTLAMTAVITWKRIKYHKPPEWP